MKNGISKFIKGFAEKVYEIFGESSGKMLLLTSIFGILASSFAQTGAILLNKKYSDSQKAFMAPQEMTEGFVTVLAIFFITKPIQKFANKCFKSGKILSSEMVDYLKKNQLIEKRGKADFDFSKSVKNIMQKIEASDAFVKSSAEQKEKMLESHTKILQDYEIMLDATSAIATTFAAMTSSAIVSPLLRNHVASKFQAASMNNAKKQTEQEQIVKPQPLSNAMKYTASSTTLKI